MKRPFDEELISAYLDGELTADEQARVEEALASDAALRHLHDDLRALRNGLQSLPQQKLDSGFVERVLRAAQAAKQAPAGSHHAAAARGELPSSANGSGPPPHLSASPSANTSAPEVSRAQREPMGQREPMAWRALVISVAALAAALLLVLALPEPFARVAQVPLEGPPAINSIAQKSTEKAAGAAQDGQELERAKAPGGKIPAAKIVAEEAAQGASPAPEQATTSPALKDRADGIEFQRRAASAELEVADDAKMRRKTNNDKFNSQDGLATRQQLNARGLSALSKALQQSASQQEKRKELANRFRDGELEEADRADSALQYFQERQEEEPLVVVRVQAGLNRQQIDQLLASHRIQLADGLAEPAAGNLPVPDALEKQASNVAPGAAQANSSAATEAADVRQNQPDKLAEAGAKKQFANVDLDAYAAAHDVMMVVAEPAQIEALVASLAGGDESASIEVGIAPKLAQQPYTAAQQGPGGFGGALRGGLSAAQGSALPTEPAAQTEPEALNGQGGAAAAGAVDAKDELKLVDRGAAAPPAGYAQRIERGRELPLTRDVPLAEKASPAPPPLAADVPGNAEVPQVTAPRSQNMRPQAMRTANADKRDPGQAGLSKPTKNEADALAPTLSDTKMSTGRSLPPAAPSVRADDVRTFGGGQALGDAAQPAATTAEAKAAADNFSRRPVRVLLVIEHPVEAIPADAVPAAPLPAGPDK